jgi:hypothetical protein
MEQLGGNVIWSHDTWSGVTTPTTLDLTFSNITVYMSRATSCDIIQISVAQPNLACREGSYYQTLD